MWALRAILLIATVSSLVEAALFANIVKSLLAQGRFSRLVKEAPEALIDTLKENEQAAGELVCDILVANSFPEFVTDVVEDLSEEAVDDLQALSNFVINIPKLAPAILSNIEEGAEDVVSVIGQLVTNPEAAITVIVGGVESVVESAWDDITSVGGEIISDIACLFKSCAESTPAEVLALVTACDQIGSGSPVTITTPGGTVAANTEIVSSISAVPTYVPPTAAATVTGTPPAPTLTESESPSAPDNSNSSSHSFGSARFGDVPGSKWCAWALVGVLFSLWML